MNIFEMTDVQKADRLYEIDQQIDLLKKEQEQLKTWLKESLDDGGFIQGSNKVKYVVSTTKKLKYGEDAALWLSENAPKALQVCASISDTKLRAAKKLGFVDATDLAVLESMAEEEEIATVRRDNKEAKAVIEEAMVI